MQIPLALTENSENKLPSHFSGRETLEAYLIFLKELKMHLENNFALQEHYRKRESNPDMRDGFLVIMETLSKIRERLAPFIERYHFAHLIPERVSLRVEKIGRSRGDPQIDTEYDGIDRLQKEIENFRIFGFDIDVIRLFIPPGTKVNKRNAKIFAKTAFRTMKPILLKKEV